MKATYWQRGESLDYVNGTDAKINANTVVAIEGRIGVAGTDINPNEKGDIHVCGVFEFAKTSANAIPMGTNVYFDGEGITEEEEGTPAGFVAEDSAAGAELIYVKIG